MNEGLFALAFLLFVSFACGLKCNLCKSYRSWEDCANRTKAESCSRSWHNRCAKFYGEEGSAAKYYIKGCLSAKDCHSFERDSKCDFENCKLYCCKGDLCNGAAPQYQWSAPCHAVMIILIMTVCNFLAASV